MNEKAKQLGWLDEQGICHFPPDVLAVCSGYKTKGIKLQDLTPDQLQKAVDKGWALFADGTGVYRTFAQYVKEYPDYPDPIFCLQQRGMWP